jgi:NADPH-dependent 2,4-dienoyl-CoA reductase/sulfur reductase-like enzyme/rhodanese-related sulfurtransferase
MKVLIIGGVATGPKVAARLKRLRPDAEITVVEQGEVISYGACGLPLYLGNLVPQLEELMMTNAGLIRDVKYFQEQKGAKFLTATRALKINPKDKTVLVKNLKTSEEKLLPYDYLVLATGAKPFLPPIPGTELGRVYTLHHPQDAQTIRQLLREKKAKHITILGAGLIGIETADALAGPRVKVTMCEALDSVLPKLLDTDMAKLVERQMRSRGVDLRLGCRIEALEGNAEGEVCRVITDQGVIETEAVIIAAGVRPNVELAQEIGLEIGATGAIKVDKNMRTSDPYIFAGGDCAEQTHVLTGKPVYIPLASTANKQGRVIADNIAGRPTEFSTVLGTSVLQAFDLNIGRTGLGEAEAQQLGYDVITSVVSGLDNTHYYPMHDGISLKLIADRTSGKLLGAQVCGQGEGIKRLDVLATALKFNAKLEDLSNLDLGYAPPFATAIDVVIHAVNTLQNKRDGLVPSFNAPEILAELKAGQEYCFVDVREQDEVQANPLPLDDVLNIPLGELRQRWVDIPPNKKVLAVCELGIRSYEAACILKGLGREQIAYLEGGTSTFRAYYDNLTKDI